MFKKVLFFSLVMALVLSTVATTAFAADLEGKVVKLEGDSALYYISVDGNRYVFPSEKAYKTWFTDFSEVLTVSTEELNEYPLVGNIRFRPGVLLVKIQSDPKVYAVAKNGTLRWIKTEGIAKDLYGENWSQFVDDISAAFFVNYSVGSPIENSSDFDPDGETDENDSIDKNRGKAFGLLHKARKASTKRCRGNSAKRICNIHDLEDNSNNEDEDEDLDGKKTVLCHFPPGNPSNSSTIEVGTRAVRAHLAHGDTFGRCEGDDDDDNGNASTTPPVISGITVSPSPATSTATTTISWTTDELSTSKVTYATSTTATSTNLFMLSDSELVTSHELVFSDLSATTTYYFFVESEDEDGNVATSTEDTFDVE